MSEELHRVELKRNMLPIKYLTFCLAGYVLPPCDTVVFTSRNNVWSQSVPLVTSPILERFLLLSEMVAFMIIACLASEEVRRKLVGEWSRRDARSKLKGGQMYYSYSLWDTVRQQPSIQAPPPAVPRSPRDRTQMWEHPRQP